MTSELRRFGGLALFVVFAVAAVLLGLTRAKDDNVPTIVRYKETLLLERDGKGFSTSGIMQSRLMIIGGGLGPVYNGQGVRVENSLAEAIAVEVAAGEYLFALPTYPYDGQTQRLSLLYAACGLPEDDRGKDRDTMKAFIRSVVSLTAVCVVPPSSWPILIHFGDMSRPQTAERIFPADLERRFGLKLQSVTVERTDAPPTQGIASLLPWVMDPKVTFGMPVTTVEAHPRSRPIVLTQEDFRWPSPIREAAWARQSAGGARLNR